MKNKLNFIIEKNMPYYESARDNLVSYIESLKDELSIMYDYNPTNYILSRIKSTGSIYEKLGRKNLAINENSLDKLGDIVGARIVCDFVDSVYLYVNKIKSNPKINIVGEKDYISKPKESGYRGYHIILKIPVTINGKMKQIGCEIQIRTLAMDSWAANDHKVSYKKDNLDTATKNSLKSCADKIWTVDISMNEIFRKMLQNNKVSTKNMQSSIKPSTNLLSYD